MTRTAHKFGLLAVALWLLGVLAPGGAAHAQTVCPPNDAGSANTILYTVITQAADSAAQCSVSASLPSDGIELANVVGDHIEFSRYSAGVQAITGLSATGGAGCSVLPADSVFSLFNTGGGTCTFTLGWTDANGAAVTQGITFDSNGVILEFTIGTVTFPTLTSFSPNTGPVGTVVTLTGTNLTQVVGAAYGRALSGGIPASFTVVSDTEIRLTIPSNALVFAPLSVVTSTSTVIQFGTNFYVKSPPVVLTSTTLPAATSGVNYTTTLTASGGAYANGLGSAATPYIFSATGLPNGLSLNAASGVISGLPTQGGTFSVTITATDRYPNWPSTGLGGSPDTKTLTLTVAPSVSVTTTLLTSGTVGATYTAPLAATGGTAPHTFTATGLPAGLAVSGTHITGTPTQAGMFTVNVMATDATTPTAYTSTAQSLTLSIAQAAQVVAFTASPLSPAAPGGTYTVTATGGASGNPVTFTIDPSSTSGACTISGATVTFVATGTCLVNANQAGTASYLAAAQVQQSIAISKASQTITFAKPADTTFGGGPVTLVATATSGLAVAFASNSTGVCTVSGITVTVVSAGQCSITATQPGNASYAAAAAVTQSFAVGKASQTITFKKPADIVFASGVTVVLQASASSGLTMTFASMTTATCTVSGSTATLLAPGNCSLTASQAGNTNYNAAPSVMQSFNVLGTPKLTLGVTASPTMIGAVGQTIAYTYTIKNSGNVPVAGLGVTDSRVTGITCSTASLAVAAVATCTGATISTAADINARGITSTATARGVFNNAAVASPPVATTVGIDIAKVQAATKSAITGMLSQRGNVLASSGPDTGRAHDRLTGGTLIGGGETDGSGGAASTAFAARGNGNGNGVLRYGFDGASFGGRGVGSGDSSPPFTSPFDRFGQNERVTRGFPDEPELPFGMRRDWPEATPPAQRAVSGGVTFSGQGDDGTGRFQFSVSLSKYRAAAEAAEQEKRAGVDQASLAAMGLGAGSPGERKLRPALFDVWLEGTSSYYRTDTIDSRRQGHAAVVSTGVDMLVRPGLLVGFMGQVDWMADRSTTLGQDRDGRGWMVGPYLSARLTPHLYIDARAAGGRSTNHVDPIGAYVDTFATSRALASAKLTGDWTSGAWRFRPSAEMIWFKETQLAYDSAIGIAVASNTFNLGRTLFGPEVGYHWTFVDKSVIEPFVGLKGVWDFSRTQETTAAGEPIGNAVLRGRLEGGLTFSTPAGIALRATGAYDGIGASNYHAVQGQMKVIVPLQ